MGADWARLCRCKEFTVDGTNIDVHFGDERRHRVYVEEEPDTYRLKAFIARQALVASLPDVPVRAWLRNRATHLVSFRIDHRRRLVAEAWVPKVGLTADEFQFYVHTVAVESDRFEYTLTGRDVE